MCINFERRMLKAVRFSATIKLSTRGALLFVPECAKCLMSWRQVEGAFRKLVGKGLTRVNLHSKLNSKWLYHLNKYLRWFSVSFSFSVLALQSSCLRKASLNSRLSASSGALDLITQRTLHRRCFWIITRDYGALNTAIIKIANKCESCERNLN